MKLADCIALICLGGMIVGVLAIAFGIKRTSDTIVLKSSEWECTKFHGREETSGMVKYDCQKWVRK